MNMKKSIYFRRVLFMLLLALLLWAALTGLIYSTISRPIFISIKAEEQQPKAEVIAQLSANNYFTSNLYFQSLMTSSQDLFDAYIFVVDGLTASIRNSSLPPEETASGNVIGQRISENLDQILTGDFTSLWFTERLELSTGMSDCLFLGVPITVQFGERDTVVGAVFFVTPLNELNAGLKSMNLALVFSSLMVFLLMLYPVYRVTARLIRPLRQTRDVALAMAEGNFDVRADTRQPGEIGELASTMNDLAGKLSESISDLTLERNRLRQILEGMGEGLLATDRDGRISRINPVLQDLLSLDKPLESGSSLDDLNVQPQLAEAYQQAMIDKIDVNVTIDQNKRIIRGQIAPLLDSQHTVVGAVGLFRDVTAAERLEQTRRDYVANVSHELRTPLTAIRALVEPLRDGMVRSEDDRSRYYDILLKEIVRLSRLINDMLELSRLQSGTLVMDQGPFDLEPLLLDLSDRISLSAEDADLTLDLPQDLSDCPTVYGNRDRVEQVLVILVDNAIKYTPAGGTVSLGVDWNDEQVRVFVSDTGIGIAQEDIDSVFDRFYKADKAHQQPGTGLGLSIAREIMQVMGQRITVTSQPGQGSVFTFTLDRADQVKQEKQ